MVLLRFAPSPTGSLHLGGLRTALFNHIYAKKLGGKWILRIEDTDAARFVDGSIADIRRSLDWAGLEYDYGPGKGGPHAPYFQSERRDLYQTYARKLLDAGHAYRCFCTPDRLAETRTMLQKRGSHATYDRACLHLTEEEVARRVRAGERSMIRMNDGSVPRRPKPKDIVFGDVRDAHASLPTDPVLLKSDLLPTYHLAVVVDDHEMGITHVLRGEEWLPSLPLHLDLYACLAVPPPEFAHLPLLRNADGSKMSKRRGDFAVSSYIEKGWEPSAVLNWLALAGWGGNPVTSTAHTPSPEQSEVLTLPELIQQFELTSLTTRGSVLDPQKLTFLNRRHLLAQMQDPNALKRIADDAMRLTRERYPNSDALDTTDFAELVRRMDGRFTNINSFPDLVAFLFCEPDYTTEEARAMKSRFTDEEYNSVIQASITLLSDPEEEITWDELTLYGMLYDLRDQCGLPLKKCAPILRHALTAEKVGLNVSTTMWLLGRSKTLARLKAALEDRS
ncbi:glutamyl-tRNA synthetase [Rickenella mellea]|uniref:Glutamate--tRNA ligase, mitochondrial n=1 Tax=Rickenella mellea TaxID=50990 RepID=A0A4Y7Q3X6_9AGAM|nr:glutamyl-tRNA synthetase [Rickenella mellea]